MHEVDVLGQRLAQRAGHRVDAAVLHEPAANLGLHEITQLAQPRLELLALQAVGELRGETLLVAAVARRALLPVVAQLARELADVLTRRTGREQREVHVEDGLERLPVMMVLHQRRAERGLERRTVAEVEMLDRAHRVEVLGHRHGQPRRAQLVHEPLQHVEQLPPARVAPHGRRCVGAAHGVGQLRPVDGTRPGAPAVAPSRSSSLRALAMSDWYLSRTCNVSAITSGSTDALPR